jgi:hypothetical protein
VADLKIDLLPVPTEPDTTSHLGNRRKQPRHRLTPGLKVQISVPPAEETAEATLVDVAVNGVGLTLEEYHPRGTILMFCCGNQRIYASVEYCRAGALAYRVGARITDVVEESE